MISSSAMEKTKKKNSKETYEVLESNKGFKISQYACAVLLIASSIALVAYQVVEIDNVASGLLYYVAQSFLLAGSIFGLDQYVRFIYRQIQEKKPQRKQKKV